LARQGAKVVVNDLDLEPAEQTASDCRDLGVEAIGFACDVADWDGAGALIAKTIEEFGSVDSLVNNAGLLRDRMTVSMTEAEWDAVIRVHLKGHFAPTRHAAAWWRAESKAGRPRTGRIVNTSSAAGLFGNVGQLNYAAAKAGIAAMTLVQAAELKRYGATSNAIAPAARTRMTETLFGAMMKAPDDPDAFDFFAPSNIAPLVAWLCSEDSGDVTGKVFEVAGGRIAVCDGWRPAASTQRDGRWNTAEVGPAVRGIIEESPKPVPVFGG
jgi:NAD(P)-dependent dehydrogenase (short-subunit alcohol dehydrogenase family)